MHDENFECILNSFRVELAEFAEDLGSGLDELSNAVQGCGEEIESVSETVLGLERFFEQRFRAYHRSLSGLQSRVGRLETMIHSEDHDSEGE
ncbi:hypothetical protein NZK35_05565 [Stieleria sp. ICT_E10.1]|uniref:hypothetical protein n=1 Tax=Stieleria sedimenti TaxID=2976331 RepID=UPI0021804224|nr:hypothetical protein [Stieleria sedimenti]MCS7466141.1 hypothetical protein [Stieleria sedimenti]